MKKTLSILMICLVVFSAFLMFASPVKSQPEKLASDDGIGDLAVDIDYVYFTVYKDYFEWNNLVCKVPKAGGSVETLMDNIKRVTEIAVDSDYVYFIDQRYPSHYSGILWRIGKNGENPTQLASELDYPWGIAQDSDYIYFSEGQVHVTTGYIKKVPKVGGLITTLATTNSPQGLVVDSNYVYFTSDRYTSSKINRVNKDGTNLVTIASGLQTNVDNLAIDNDYVYFAEYTAGQHNAGRVGRVPKVGGTVQILTSEQANPGDVDVDLDFVYFSECSAGNIKRVPKSGGSVEMLAGGYPGTGSVIVESNYVYYSVDNWGQPHPLNGVYRLQLIIPAVVDINPDTLSLKSKGEWITAYIELPEGYDVNDINVTTVMLNDTVPAELHPTEVGDYDSDGIPDLMVKFSRAEVIGYVLTSIDWSELEDLRRPYCIEVTLAVTGKLYDDTPFEGDDTVYIIFGNMPIPR